MKTNDLIHNLASELKEPSGVGFYTVSFMTWAATSLALLALAFSILSFRHDLIYRLSSGLFQTETTLYLALFFISAFIAYRSSIPTLLRPQEQRVGWGVLALSMGVLISQVSFIGLKTEFLGEMNFYRGRCGPIILAIGVLDALLIMALARRAAPVNPSLTGAWIALSAGALGLFSMQFVCAHGNFLHMVIWHAVPVAMLAGGGAVFGKRLLKW